MVPRPRIYQFLWLSRALKLPESTSGLPYEPGVLLYTISICWVPSLGGLQHSVICFIGFMASSRP